MAYRRQLAIACIGLFWGLTQALAHSSQSFAQIPVSLKGKMLSLDYANTPELQTHGLAHKRVLCDDCGMLFDYANEHVVALSTQDVFIPIDVAFVRGDGVIIKIVQMLPFDDREQSSEKPVRYALAMNRSWFKRQGIKVGDEVGVQTPKL